jgi:cytoskeletal protein CcmA (bactofilin family)
MLEVKRKPASPGAAASAAASTRVYRDVGKVETHSIRAVVNPAREPQDFNGKLPVITGECHFKGSMSIDGLLSGQVGVKSGMNLKQKPSPAFAVQAELSGELLFRDMIRVNGHIAGSVYSKVGTIIIDNEAQVDANVDVAVAVISGTVRGDIVARERVELGPASRIYGNIWTRSLIIKDGAIFEGVCRMIEEDKMAV